MTETEPKCYTCLDTQRLINRDGERLTPIKPGEPSAITASELPSHGRDAYVVGLGEVCPCPKCWRSAHDLEVEVRWAGASFAEAKPR